MSLSFSKPPLSIADQVRLLQSRGMVVSDVPAAEFFLGEINYYRLTAYWLPFRRLSPTESFLPGTTFEKVLAHYTFDRELRLLLLDAIERIEVAVRTRWAYEMAHAHGPHSHMDSSLAKDFRAWVKNMADLQREIGRADEVFIKHYRKKYDDPQLPPIWAVCEVMSLGLLSRWYSHLGPDSTRKAISAHFQLQQLQLEGLLEHLAYLRNLCAHHSRLWNRHFTKTMPLPRKKPTGLRAQVNQQADRQIYNSLVIMLHLMDCISPKHHWRSRLLELLRKYPVVSRDAMGFVKGWEKLPIWQEAV